MAAPRALNQLSLSRRLALAMLLITVIAILGSSGTFLLFERHALQEALIRNLDTQAQVLGSSLEEELGAGDRARARRTLASLARNPRIDAAACYDRKGLVFADYHRGTEPQGLPAPPAGDSTEFIGDHLRVFRVITVDGRPLGTVFLQSDLREIRLRFLWLAIPLALAALVVFFLVFLVSLWVKRRLFHPILRLAEEAKRITQSKDYSLRLAPGHNGELSALGEALNEMLAQIQDRDAQLTGYQDRLEEQVVLRSDQLLRANTQLLLAKEKAEEASRAKSAFLANMSHELRTPLNAILLYSELVADEMAERGMQDVVPDLENIRRAGKHLLSLIDEILDLSKIEAGRMNVFLEDCHIPSIVHEVVATAEPLVSKNRNRFGVKLDPTIQVIRSDVKMLRQIIYNLLSNAAKFTQDGEIHLEVSHDPEPDQLRLSVSDTGIGMSETQIARIFQEFTQADDSTTRKYGGTGLGLTLCRKFTELLGGTTQVTSKPGEGSTFTVCLPTHRAPQSRAPERPAPAGRGLSRGKILIIDDDPSLREAVSRMLTKEGFWVAMASSGEEGLQMAGVLLPNIITLDIVMPGMDGWQVLGRLKADPLLKGIPVILLTMMEGRSRGYALGASAVVQKPISREELLGLIHDLEKGHGAPILVVEDDLPTQDILQRILGDAGWECIGALNGQEALRQLQNARPGMILLDLMLPEMDGFQLLAQLQDHPDWREIPVVVLTAKDLTPEDVARLQGAQVQHVLRKGACSKDELVEMVRKITLRWTQPPPGA